MPRHYLDHASTTPPRPEAAAAVLAWYAGDPPVGDPGRVHTEGRIARATVEDARERVAALFGARPRQVVFTSGATEAVGTAVRSAARSAPGPMVLAEVEHSCVREAASRAGPVVTVVVDGVGRVHPEAVAEALETAARIGTPALVHCQLANHEVGTLQPVADVAEICRRYGVALHVDAAAGAGHVPIDVGSMGADFVSISSHKLGGPPGVGALVVAPGRRLQALLVGGEQERGRRAGLENVPAICGFAAAAAALAEGGRLEAEADHASRLTTTLLGELADIEGVRPIGDTVGRVPHIVCFDVRGVEAEAVLLGLDQAGIAAHSGSACSSESLAPSPVLEAMGVDAERSLRLSVGWPSTSDDVGAVVAALPLVLERLRALRG